MAHCIGFAGYSNSGKTTLSGQADRRNEAARLSDSSNET